MQKIAILLTVFNRKEKTLNCLYHLHQCLLPQNVSFEVYLTDDGSTDGTSEAVKKTFPAVIILQGSGNLYWNRGMINSWTEAEKKEYDYYLWLNDDTLLYPNALLELTECANSEENKKIICGSTTSTKDKNKITYGGYLLNRAAVIPNGEKQHCDYFNGNIVLIPQYVYAKVGKIDAAFHHAVGDFDYGLRAQQLGIESLVCPHINGECDEHEDLLAWCNPKTPLKKRLKLLYTPLGNHPIEFFIFEKRHNGLLKAYFHFLTNHLRAIFPSLWVMRQK